MTLFNNVETNEQIKPYQVATHYLMINERTNKDPINFVSKFIKEVLASNDNPDDKQLANIFINNYEMNDNVKKLIVNAPPTLNPNLKDTKITELHEDVLEEYKEFMGIEDKGDYYSLEKPIDLNILDLHTTQLPFLKEISYGYREPFFYNLRGEESIESSSIATFETLVPHSFYEEIIEKYSNETGTLDFLTDTFFKKHFDKENFNHECFMDIYSLYLHDYILREIYGEYFNYFNKMASLKFVEKGQGDFTFEDLGDFKIPNASMKSFVKVVYYNELFQTMSEHETNDIGFKIDRPLKDYDFVFQETNEDVLYANNLSKTGLYLRDTIYSDNYREILSSKETIERYIDISKEMKLNDVVDKIEKLLYLNENNMNDLQYFRGTYLNHIKRALDSAIDRVKSGQDVVNSLFAWTQVDELLNEDLDSNIKSLEEQIEEVERSLEI